MCLARFSHIGGAHVQHQKLTAESSIVKMDIPGKVVIPMIQHVGVPCGPLVKKGDEVKVGQVIGDTGNYVSAPVHSSVSGVVTRVGPAMHPGGGREESVEIETDGLQAIHEDVAPPEFEGKDGLFRIVRASGLVGLGGAGFPTHVKLNAPKDKNIDALIINGAECEPYITSDYRSMIENPSNIIEGINIVKTVLGIKHVYIGIEDNKPGAVKAMSSAAEKEDGVNVVVLSSIYPQGAEKTLIYSCTGRRVPPGKLPMDVGALVLNVNTVAMIATYAKTGMPLVNKVVTISGGAVMNPMNVEVPIGTLLKDVFEFCGGFKCSAQKVLMGGPMTGIAQHSLDVPIIKNTNAVLAFDGKEAVVHKETACIRCGRCARSCPMHLMPMHIDLAALKADAERLEAFRVIACFECGVCAYVCPARRRIVQAARLGKSILRETWAKEKGQAQAKEKGSAQAKEKGPAQAKEKGPAQVQAQVQVQGLEQGRQVEGLQDRKGGGKNGQ